FTSPVLTRRNNPSSFVLRHSSFSRGSQVEIVPHPLVLRPSYFVLFSIPFCRRGFQVQVAPPIADSRFACSQVKAAPPHSSFVLRTSSLSPIHSFRPGSPFEFIPAFVFLLILGDA